MSVERQVLNLVKCGTGKAAPELTHALSIVGNGSMSAGIKKVFEVGGKTGFLFGVGSTVVVVYIVYIGGKRWREYQTIITERAVTSMSSNEAISVETDVQETDDFQSPIPKEDVVEQQRIDEPTHTFQSTEKLLSTAN